MNCKSTAKRKRERELTDKCVAENVEQLLEMRSNKFSENWNNMSKQSRNSNVNNEIVSYEISNENENIYNQNTKDQEEESVLESSLFEYTREHFNPKWWNDVYCQIQEELEHLSTVDMDNLNLEINTVKAVLQRTHLVEMRDKEMLEWLTWLEEWLHIGDAIGSTHELCSSWSDLRFIVIDVLKQLPWWRLIDTSADHSLIKAKHQSRFAKEKLCNNESNVGGKDPKQASKEKNELASNSYKCAYRLRDKWHRPIQLAIEKVCLTLINQSQHAISGVLEIIFKPFTLLVPVSDGVKRIVPIDSVIRIFNAIANKYSTYYLWNLFTQCVVSLLPKRRWNETRSHLAATVLLISLALEEFVPMLSITISKDNSEIEESEEQEQDNYWSIPCFVCISKAGNKHVTKEVYFPELAELYLYKTGTMTRERLLDQHVTENIEKKHEPEYKNINNANINVDEKRINFKKEQRDECDREELSENNNSLIELRKRSFSVNTKNVETRIEQEEELSYSCNLKVSTSNVTSLHEYKESTSPCENKKIVLDSHDNTRNSSDTITTNCNSSNHRNSSGDNTNYDDVCNQSENISASGKNYTCKQKTNSLHTDEKTWNVTETASYTPKSEKITDNCNEVEINDTVHNADGHKRLHAFGGAKANKLISYQAPLISFTLNWLLDLELTLDRVDGCEVSLYTPSSPISSRASSRASFSVVHANHNAKLLTNDVNYNHRSKKLFNNHLFSAPGNRNIYNFEFNKNVNKTTYNVDNKNYNGSGSVCTNLSKTNSIPIRNSETQNNINGDLNTELLDMDANVEKIFTQNALSHLRILRTCTAYIFVKLSFNIRKLNEHAVKLSSLEWWQDGLAFHLQLLLRSNTAVCLHYLIPSLALVSTDDDAIDLLHKVISTVTKGHLPIKLTRGEAAAQPKFTNINNNNNNNNNNNSGYQNGLTSSTTTSASMRQSNRMRMVMRSAIPQVIPLNQRIQAATFIYPMYKFFHSRIGHNEGIRKRLLKCVMQEIRNSHSSRISSTLPEANSRKSSYGGSSSYIRPYDKKSSLYGTKADIPNKLAEVLFVQYAAISELTHEEIVPRSLHTPAPHHVTPLQQEEESVLQLRSEERLETVAEELNHSVNTAVKNSNNVREENESKNACELITAASIHDYTVKNTSHRNMSQANKENDVCVLLKEFVNKYCIYEEHEEEEEQIDQTKFKVDDDDLLNEVETKELLKRQRAEDKTASEMEEWNLHQDSLEQEQKTQVNRSNTTSASSVECNSHLQWNWSLMESEGLLRSHLLNQCPWQQHLTQLVTTHR